MNAIRTLKAKLIILIILFLIIPSVISSMNTFFQTKEILTDKIVVGEQYDFEQMNSKILQFTSDVRNLAYVLESDAEVKELISSEELPTYEKYILSKKVLDKFTSISSVFHQEYDIHITIIDQYNSFYTSWNKVSGKEIENEILSSEWFASFRNSEDYYSFILPHENYTLSDNSKFMTYIKKFKGVSQTEDYSYLLISVRLDDIKDQYNRMMDAKNGIYLMVSKDERLVIHNNQDMSKYVDSVISNESGLIKIQDKNYRIIQDDIEVLGAKVYSLIPLDELLNEVNELQLKKILLELVIYSIFIIIAILLIVRITEPIKILREKMLEIRKGNFDIELKKMSNDEIGDLTQDFNYMIVDIKQLMQDIKQKEREKKEVHLKALQAQINPHFLFNSLNAIKWNAYLKEQAGLGDMIASLGSLYEYILRNRSEYILLKDEIDYVKKYMSLMELRYYKKITLNVSFPENLINIYTLKFILQPIIENSIIHGFDNLKLSGSIDIKIFMKNNQLKITVKDNGKGISKDKLDNILNHQLNTSSSRFTNIGISNVDERIKLNFGSEFGIHITSQIGVGTTVEINQPLLKDINEDDEHEN